MMSLDWPLRSSVVVADDLVAEYLLFRGFPKASRSFETERRQDRLHEFQVDKVVSKLQHYISTQNYDGFSDLWRFLDERFFTQLDPSFHVAVQKLELSLQRLYVVSAVKAQQTETVREFFDKHAETLHCAKDWQPWFALPFLPRPESDPLFEVYFSQSWADALLTSLTNFLTTVFQSIPLPKMLCFNFERLQRKKLESEVESLQCEVKTLRHLLDTAEAHEKISRKKLHDMQKELEAKHEEIVYLRGRNESLQATVSPTCNRIGTPDIISSPKIDEPDYPNVSPKTPLAAAFDDVNLPSSVQPPTLSRSESSESSTERFQIVKQTVLSGHNGPIKKCRFSSQGTNFASASEDCTVRIWALDAASSSRTATIFCQSEVLCLDWDLRTDRMLLFGTADRRVKLWNVDTKKMQLDIKVDAEYPRVTDLACSPDGGSFVVAAQTVGRKKLSQLSCWNLKTGRMDSVINVEPGNSVLNCLRFNHNGSLLVVGDADGMVRIFDTHANVPIMGWPAHQGSVTSVQFGVDETSVVSAGTDGKIIEWSIHSLGNFVRCFTVEGFTSNAQQVAIDIAMCADGSHFVTSSKTRDALIYSIHHRDGPIQRISGHEAAVSSVDWHCSLNTILTGSNDSTLRITTLSDVTNTSS